ncbi:VacJ family lipoprotein [Mesorhizobium sp. M00.F.Ca.ET.151.01.1.1]|uniref:MlaA family lipoprotein n=1 Tax=Stenotrophomonas TaxID=40323 RepID=UPI00113F15B2|nr:MULTISPECIES: VacJ family lipoprotein [Stenotrophomonas]TGR37498.1 VacJ family lipoprotein [bacterium M00.F.Ca.ET.199.01.1.1]TGS97888.1 VacJ family lipoprotein [bacterium M00.F.Ca.ET.177.01.1.1]TGT53910.1 VacJ family lipoprotein [Mesorhizobium sp. M00.F.Ca.ET.170.01.1.1]TGU04878.1 VacJ family lipoprotein [bacterium M00.F.Ca.ET.163.01.1.1]TGU87149.1 VacJ family lipoprotein [Mesorhizobium sp. M00.F.Ca.ET.151.01.1.1]TGV51462.1 VacJ family lipoprotein [bacterium M00.F.Ca.ET.141.01.1.1]
MNVVRTFPLILLATALTACAGKPARSDAPVASTVVAASTVAEAPAATADTGGADATPAAAAATPPAPSAPSPAASAHGAETSAAKTATATAAGGDDDFDALYGGTGTTSSAAAYDPWEPFNRKVHTFNNAVDRGVARPLATAYTHVVPRFARTGISNFFSNLRAPVTITNQLLQGRGADAWDSLGRFLMNSTLGIGGLFDPASKAMVPRRNEDFGQTLGAWGWRRSRYVELPFFGPRTVRDVFGLAGDIPLSPIRRVEEDKIRIGLQGLQLVDTRAQLLAIDDLRDTAVDEYALVRDAWMQRRNYQIENDLRSKRDRGHDDANSPIPVDAMPMPQWTH